ncbi:MAG: GIY-YIG nuclease family protein, partial [Terriglobia bacterium]
MRKLTVDFLDGIPHGLRRVRESNWNGICLIASRTTLNSNPDWTLFDKPGVYILVGAPEQSGGEFCQPRVYIGQGDSVSERLQSHLKSESKVFWQTAVVFQREPELHVANAKYLESRLCTLAEQSGKCTVVNAVSPKLPSLATEEDDMKGFLDRLLFVVEGLGWDFFQEPAVLASKEPALVTLGEAPKVPAKLQSVFDEIRKTLMALPNVEFYWTRTPDYRAKLTLAGASDFRVFARVRVQRNRVRLGLK